MYTCIYIYTYICVYIHVYIHIHVCIHTYIHIYIYIHTHIHTRTHSHNHLQSHNHLRTHPYTHTPLFREKQPWTSRPTEQFVRTHERKIRRGTRAKHRAKIKFAVRCHCCQVPARDPPVFVHHLIHRVHVERAARDVACCWCV